MCRFFVLSIWLLVKSCMTSGGLVAKNYGIHHIERQDVGMVFCAEKVLEFPPSYSVLIRKCLKPKHQAPEGEKSLIKWFKTWCIRPSGDDVEIKNEGKQWCAINARMIKCCETICPSDVDCEYLHDRVGECLIAIGYTTKNNQTGELHQKVKFDTSVSSYTVRPVLQGYYGTGEARKCFTVDLDTLDDCRPVNCHIKYNGKRNFFNRRQQRCQAVPICIADTTKELPDVAYVPASNTCRDLENAVNEVEVRALSQGIAEAAWRSEPLPYLSNIHCHHGTTDNATGFCVCYDGWTSKPVDNLEPSTEMIHLCNVRTLFWPILGAGRMKTIVTVVSFIIDTLLKRRKFAWTEIAALLGVLVVLFCCAMAYVMRSTHHHPDPGDVSICGNETVPSCCVPSSSRSRNTFDSSSTRPNSCKRSNVQKTTNSETSNSCSTKDKKNSRY